MIYLNESDIKKICINRDEIIDVFEENVKWLGNKNYAQPIKPSP